MNLIDTLLRIEDLDTDYTKQSYPEKPLPNANLIIWVRSTNLESDYDTIHCLRDHQPPEISASKNATITLISISRNLLEVTNGYTFSLFERNLFSLYSPVTLHLNRKKQEMIGAILETIREELKSATDNNSEVLKVLITLFLLRLSECCTKQTMPHENREQLRFVQKYLDLVQTHFLEWRRVSNYADHLCVTPNYLNAKIKKATGYPAGYHIQQRIILEAKRQALRHGLRMKEVAHYLGFDDSAHFSKYFKNGTGVNFTSYMADSGT